MTFVITQGCCNDSSCISVCPVQCIRPRPGDPDFNMTEQLYIEPGLCIDCGACLDECPVDAIYQEWDLPDALSGYLGINASYFETRPIEESMPPIPERRVLPKHANTLSVAMVGSGPAACYAADELSDIKGVKVSVFEQLPTPFGLIRSGVAPDHPNTKLIANRFNSVLNRSNVRCFFNVEVGRDITLAELLEHHHAVIWAGGALDERQLGIPGEELAGFHSARDFIAWCNGHPDYADGGADLSGCRAIVIGNGNVGLDAARLLTHPASVFAKTDISDQALEVLSASQVSEVVVTARRGPQYASYSTGEFLALAENADVSVLVVGEDLTDPPTSDDRRSAILAGIERRPPEPDDRSIILRYGLRPVSVNGTDRVESVTYTRPDGSEETIEADLVLSAIGSRGRAIDSLPFDDVTGTLPNQKGRVVDPESGSPVPGVYCSGWIKRGASGMIGSNRADSAESVDALLQDLAAGRLTPPAHPAEALIEMMSQRVPDLVDKDAWRRIDQAERQRGRESGRPRRKFLSRAELLSSSAVGPTP